jgi:hypothetical protein
MQLVVRGRGIRFVEERERERGDLGGALIR